MIEMAIYFPRCCHLSRGGVASVIRPTTVHMQGPETPVAPCYVIRRGRWYGPAFHRTRSDALGCCYRPRAAEIKRCHTREEALAYLNEEAWLEKPPAKRRRLEQTTACEIHCYGTADRETGVGGIGVFFGPGDERNISARIKGTGCGRPDHSEVSDRDWAELCAVYVALKNAPTEGPVVISTPSRYAYVMLENWVVGWTKNGTHDTMRDAIAHKLEEAGRRVRVRYGEGAVDEKNDAVRLAHAALDRERLHATLPRLPLPADRYPPHHEWGIRD
jgi:ribonuclease HI